MTELGNDLFGEAVQDISRAEYIKLFFGSTHNLDVRAAIFDYEPLLPEPFTMKNIVDKISIDPETGKESVSIPPVVVRTEMIKLKKLGMIANLPKTDPKEVPYRRTLDPGWAIVPVALEALAIRFSEYTR